MSRKDKEALPHTISREGVSRSQASPLVFILVLNWNGCEDTLRCLESLGRLSYPNYRIVVVDNASHDQSEDRIRLAYPKVDIIQTGSNLGFGGGNNVGMQYALKAGADLVLVLNNDTLVPDDFLEAMVSAMEQNPRLGILGLDGHDPTSDSIVPVGPFPPGVTRPAPDGPIAARIPGVRLQDHVHGSCMLLRRAALEQLNGFDVSYFHYWEDLDLCWRAWEVGWQVGMLEGYRITHWAGSATAGQSALKMYYNLRNLLLFTARANRRSVRRQMLEPITFRIWASCVLGLRGFLRPSVKVAILRALFDAARGKFGRSNTYSPS